MKVLINVVIGVGLLIATALIETGLVEAHASSVPDREVRVSRFVQRYVDPQYGVACYLYRGESISCVSIDGGVR